MRGDLKGDGRAHRFSGQPDSTRIDLLFFDQPFNCALDVAAFVKPVRHIPAFAVAVPVEYKHIQTRAPEESGWPNCVSAIVPNTVKHGNGGRFLTGAHPPAVQACAVE